MVRYSPGSAVGSRVNHRAGEVSCQEWLLLLLLNSPWERDFRRSCNVVGMEWRKSRYSAKYDILAQTLAGCSSYTAGESCTRSHPTTSRPAADLGIAPSLGYSYPLHVHSNTLLPLEDFPSSHNTSGNSGSLLTEFIRPIARVFPSE
jgi:hypothetical protein